MVERRRLLRRRVQRDQRRRRIPGRGLRPRLLRVPPAAAAAGFFAAVSTGASGLGTLFTGIEHGFTSGEFFESAIGTGLSLVTFGQSKWIGAADKALGGKLIKPVVGKIADVGEDVVSGATKVLSSIF